jgi:uncharacterized membrane protein YccC
MRPFDGISSGMRAPSFRHGAEMAGELARRWWPAETADAMRLGVTSLVALYLAMYFELDDPYWAGWTVFSVSLATRANSIQKSTSRAFSTLLGAVVSIVLMDNFGQSTLGYDVALALWLGLMTYCASLEQGVGSYGFALMGYTVPILTLGNVEAPLNTFDTAVSRCSELILGVACAYVSSVLVARGTQAVRRDLADAIEVTAQDCAVWDAACHETPVWQPPPLGRVLKLDRQIADAMIEQPSLRMGARAVCHVPQLLLSLVADRLRKIRLGIEDHELTLGFLLIPAVARTWGNHPKRGPRGRGAPALATDCDRSEAVHNAIRTVIAVSLVNAFWYASHWSAGATAATWTAILCVLLSSHPNPADTARHFLAGGVLAILVGLFLRYDVLTTTGSYGLFAAVLFPCCFLAALARSDVRAKAGPGFAFVVFGVISPENTMTYNLPGSLNDGLAQLVGLGIAVVAFSALPPPATPKASRRRVMRRMVRDVRAAALWPSILLPPAQRWLARMFDRLNQLSTESQTTQVAAQTLLLVGQGLLALHNIDDDLRRRAGRIIFASGIADENIEVVTKKLASVAAACANLRAQHELLDLAGLLEANRNAFVTWPVNFHHNKVREVA